MFGIVGPALVGAGEGAGIPLAVADGVVLVAPAADVGGDGTGDGVGRVVDGVVPVVVGDVVVGGVGDGCVEGGWVVVGGCVEG